MTSTSIEAVGLGKRYFLGENSSRDRLRRALRGIAPTGADSEASEVWAVRDVSFSIAEGERIGIIGRNGAGKSTLLRMLSRVTKPTEGRARIRGRVATMLEVGTGFHPELTGRDNVFLSGTIMGMTYAEVAKKFDEIVAFAEVEQFIDTPVKRYSSGMYVRLAFAVAAFLEPDILIVDEVLAVGDLAFQRKSLGRLNDASRQQGRTVLFVSHNMQAVRTFCQRTLLLEKGRLAFDGPVEFGIERYLRQIPRTVDIKGKKMADRLHRSTGSVRFTNATCSDDAGSAKWTAKSGANLELCFEFEAVEPVPSLTFYLRLRNAATGDTITALREVIARTTVGAGRKGKAKVTFGDLSLRPSELSLYVWLGRADERIAYDIIDENVELPLLKIVADLPEVGAPEGIVSLPYQFEVQDLIQ